MDYEVYNTLEDIVEDWNAYAEEMNYPCRPALEDAFFKNLRLAIRRAAKLIGVDYVDFRGDPL